MFGEHQDYLGLPVIAAAIPLRCRVEVTSTPNERTLELQIPALQQIWRWDIDQISKKLRADDFNFALAAIIEALKDGWVFPCGAKCGCSSSSAFCVAWVQALARLAGKQLSPLELAQHAHRSEVLHFDAPGGTMDHIASSLGGVLRIGPGMWDVKVLPMLSSSSSVWVLADSGQPKDTMKHLQRCKGDRLALLKHLGNVWDADETKLVLSENENILLNATRTNRNTEQQAAAAWGLDMSGAELGKIMNRHHEALRDGLLLSTPHLEAMQKAAIEAGAWGFKLVGSGGGGCGIAWVPRDKAKRVAKSMEEAGAISAWEIDLKILSSGATFER